jgi:hypothetical protein
LDRTGTLADKAEFKNAEAAISSHTVMIASWTAQWSFQAD